MSSALRCRPQPDRWLPNNLAWACHSALNQTTRSTERLFWNSSHWHQSAKNFPPRVQKLRLRRRLLQSTYANASCPFLSTRRESFFSGKRSFWKFSCSSSQPISLQTNWFDSRENISRTFSATKKSPLVNNSSPLVFISRGDATASLMTPPQPSQTRAPWHTCLIKMKRNSVLSKIGYSDWVYCCLPIIKYRANSWRPLPRKSEKPGLSDSALHRRDQPQREPREEVYSRQQAGH